MHSLAAEIAMVHDISLDKIKAKLTEVLLSVCNKYTIFANNTCTILAKVCTHPFICVTIFATPLLVDVADNIEGRE